MPEDIKKYEMSHNYRNRVKIDMLGWRLHVSDEYCPFLEYRIDN